MARVKFNVNTEYAYIQNFKILQSALPQSSFLLASARSNIACQIALQNMALIEQSPSSRW
jgi:hypothetical protein